MCWEKRLKCIWQHRHPKEVQAALNCMLLRIQFTSCNSDFVSFLWVYISPFFFLLRNKFSQFSIYEIFFLYLILFINWLFFMFLSHNVSQFMYHISFLIVRNCEIKSRSYLFFFSLPVTETNFHNYDVTKKNVHGWIVHSNMHLENRFNFHFMTTLIWTWSCLTNVANLEQPEQWYVKHSVL